jgi:hypothetical protein
VTVGEIVAGGVDEGVGVMVFAGGGVKVDVGCLGGGEFV